MVFLYTQITILLGPPEGLLAEDPGDTMPNGYLQLAVSDRVTGHGKGLGGGVDVSWHQPMNGLPLVLRPIQGPSGAAHRWVLDWMSVNTTQNGSPLAIGAAELSRRPCATRNNWDRRGRGKK